MMRRLMAGLLAIMIMISVLPAGVMAVTLSPKDYEELFAKYELYEPGTQYAPGTAVWIQGSANKPSPDDIIGEDESKEYEWVTLRESDRSRISVPSCMKGPHITCNNLENEGCMLDENGQCTREIYPCKPSHYATNAYYLFRASAKGEDNGIGGGSGSSGNTGGNRIPGSASLTVHNIAYEENGSTAVQGATFLLQKPDTYNPWQNVQKGTTDSNGNFEFYNIVLSEEEETWRLVQQSLANTPLQDKYKNYSDIWYITFARAADNSVYIKDVELELKKPEEPPVHESFYDDTTKTITVVNERLWAKITVNMEFVGIETKNLPTDEEFGIDVIITREGDSNFEPIVMEFPGKGLGQSRWQAQTPELVTGTYCLEIDNEYGMVPEYEQGEVKTLLTWADGSGNETELTNTVKTGYNRTNPIFTITNYYTYTGIDMEPETSNTIIIQTKDEETKELLPGAAYGLYKNADDDLSMYVDALFSDTDADGKITIEGLEKHVGSTFVLRQHTAPEGYQLQETYRYIRISDVDGVIQVRACETPDQEGGEDIGVDRSGKQIVTFRNQETPPPVEKTTSTVTFQVEVDTKGALEDTAYVQSLMDAEYPVYVKWDEGASDPVKMKAGMENVFEVEIPVGTPYEIIVGDEENAYETTVSNRIAEVTGRITGDSTLTVTARYTIVNAGEKLSVKKVDSETRAALPGAAFTLKDAEGKPLKENIISGETGELDILAAVNHTPGKYSLEETSAPANYQKLTDAISIDMGYVYTPVEKDGLKILEQVFTAKDMTHTNVKQEDGVFAISNSVDPNVEITVKLTCEVAVDMKAAQADDEYVQNLKEKEYNFYVEWDGGKSELLPLTDGKSGEIKLSIPAGAPYQIQVEGEEKAFTTIFTDRNGGQNESRRIGDTDLLATIQYVVEAGDYNVELTMVKISGRNTSQTLKGAEFELRNEASKTLKSYTTRDDGVIKIGKEIGNKPGSFKLKETTAPEGYVKLPSSILINLNYGYDLEERNGQPVLVQDLEASVSSSDVKTGADKYYIKNYLIEDNPYTGDRFNTALWVSALVISAAGIALLLTVQIKKKRVMG